MHLTATLFSAFPKMKLITVSILDPYSSVWFNARHIVSTQQIFVKQMSKYCQLVMIATLMLQGLDWTVHFS